MEFISSTYRACAHSPDGAYEITFYSVRGRLVLVVGVYIFRELNQDAMGAVNGQVGAVSVEIVPAHLVRDRHCVYHPRIGRRVGTTRRTRLHFEAWSLRWWQCAVPGSLQNVLAQTVASWNA